VRALGEDRHEAGRDGESDPRLKLLNAGEALGKGGVDPGGRKTRVKEFEEERAEGGLTLKLLPSSSL